LGHRPQRFSLCKKEFEINAASYLFCKHCGQQFKDDHARVRVAVLQTRLEQTHNVGAALRRVL
jgi:hypothetical protein